MNVIYMAHALSGDIDGNIEKALKWMRWIEEQFPVAVCASWLLEVMIWDDDDPAQRAAGIARDLVVLERCDELWLVGSHVSSGMAAERDHALKKGLKVRDLTTLELALPPQLTVDLPPAYTLEHGQEQGREVSQASAAQSSR